MSGSPCSCSGSCACDGSRKVPVSPVPRFTTLIGASSFTSLPIDVCGKDTVTLQAWRGPIVGDGTFALYLEQSIDAEHWMAFNASGIDPGASQVKSLDVCPSFRWFRTRIETTGSAQVTCWVEGGIK